MDIFKPADYHRYAYDELAACVQRCSVNGYTDRMKCIIYKVNGITDDKMLDCFIIWLQVIIGCIFLKENL